MDHFLFTKPLDLSDPNVDIEYLKEQLMVATALNENPCILTYMIKQAELNAHDLLNYSAVSADPSIVKSKLIQVQASNEVTGHYIRLANAVPEMVAKLTELTTTPNDPSEY